MSIKKELIKTFKNIMSQYFGKIYSASELKISDKSVGGKVEIIAADGTLAPAEDGDYAMEDGFAFTVKDGAIASIVGEVEQDKVEDTPASGTTEEVKAEDAPAEEAPVEDTAVADLTARVDAIETMLKEFMDSMNMEKTESAAAVEAFAKEVKTLNENIVTLAKIPVQASKTNVTPTLEESKHDKMVELAKILNKK